MSADFLALAIGWEDRAERLEVSAGILSGESKARTRAEISTLKSCARAVRALAKESRP